MSCHAAFTEAYCERNDVEADNIGIVIFQPIVSTLVAVTTELALRVGRFSSRFIYQLYSNWGVKSSE